MSIITLTTDFGYKDHFVGATKGKIISENNEISIIDISHDIDKFNVTEAGYCIASAYNNFPKGSIHIVCVNSERVNNIQHIAMQWDDHYFICADNGILSFLTQKKNPQKIVSINIHDRLVDDATDMDAFIKVACHIARGGLLNVIGKEIQEINTISEVTPQISKNRDNIKGHVIYIDDFGNCVTNISKKVFDEIGIGRAFEIYFSSRNKISRINKFYGDFPNQSDMNDSKALAIFNENKLLEIAVYKGNHRSIGSASSLLGLQYRDVVQINFYE